MNARSWPGDVNKFAPNRWQFFTPWRKDEEFGVNLGISFILQHLPSLLKPHGEYKNLP